MASVTRSIAIGAPAAKVWERVADLPHVAKLHPAATGASLVGQKKSGVGATRRLELEEGHLVEEVVDWKENRGMTLRLKEVEGLPLRSAHTALRIEPAGDGSAVAQTIDFQPKGALGFLLKGRLRRDLEATLRNLKDELEGRPVDKPAPKARKGRGAKASDKAPSAGRKGKGGAKASAAKQKTDRRGKSGASARPPAETDDPPEPVAGFGGKPPAAEAAGESQAESGKKKSAR